MKPRSCADTTLVGEESLTIDFFSLSFDFDFDGVFVDLALETAKDAALDRIVRTSSSS